MNKLGKKGLWYDPCSLVDQLTGKGDQLTGGAAGMGDMDGGHWIPWERLRD